MRWPKKIVVEQTLEGVGLWPMGGHHLLTEDQRIYVLAPKRKAKKKKKKPGTGGGSK